MIDIFSIFLLEKEIYRRDRFQQLCLLTNQTSFVSREIFFGKKIALLDQKQQYLD